MARTHPRFEADDGPEDWVDLWETDPGFWDDTPEWGVPITEAQSERMMRSRDSLRDHPAGNRRVKRRRDRGGWGPYAES